MLWLRGVHQEQGASPLNGTLMAVCVSGGKVPGSDVLDSSFFENQVSCTSTKNSKIEKGMRIFLLKLSQCYFLTGFSNSLSGVKKFRLSGF